MQGLVFDIQRYSTHDGPGIRTVVFFKGCPLRCAWCENPESQENHPEILHDPDRCIGCEACLSPKFRKLAIKTESGSIRIDRTKSADPGIAMSCPSLAIRVAGTSMDAETVMAMVREDMAFYRKSGGGLTLSGGEPLLQLDFCETLAKMALEEGITVAIETCLAVSLKAVERMAALPVLWLADLKHTDEAQFRQGTGGELSLVRKNLDYLASRGANVVLRIPVVPGFNDDEPTQRALLKKASALATRLRRVDLLPYHELARGKYLALGRTYPLKPGLKVPGEFLDRLIAVGRELGLDISIGG